MSVTKTVSQIDSASASYAPAVLAGVIGVEQAAAALPGETKLQLVVNTILAGSAAGASLPIPAVAGISALVNLFVQILNLAGVFGHAAPLPATGSAA